MQNHEHKLHFAVCCDIAVIKLRKNKNIHILNNLKVKSSKIPFDCKHKAKLCFMKCQITFNDIKLLNFHALDNKTKQSNVVVFVYTIYFFMIFTSAAQQVLAVAAPNASAAMPTCSNK